MFSTMLLAISVVALSQFALYYWRAVLAGVAAQPVSDQVLAAASVRDRSLGAGDFKTLVSLHDLTLNLNPGDGGLRSVRLYAALVQAIGTVAGSLVPAAAAWSENELAVCARYTAVQIGRRLQSNLALAAALRSC
jgi:hypothetical protein